MPDLAPPPALRRRAVAAATHRVLGASLVVGAAALAVASVTQSPLVNAVIPATWVIGAVLAFAARRTASTSHEPVDDADLDRARALLFAGIALLGPLTLHALWLAPAWAPTPYDDLARDRSFAEWVRCSLFLAGPAHLVFAALCAWRGGYGAADGPRLGVIGVVTTIAGAYTLPWYSVFALLPAIYVGVTASALLFAMKHLERADA